jgi:hypothetical protein
MALLILAGVMVRPAAGDSCADEERDERGQCPSKDVTPSLQCQ